MLILSLVMMLILPAIGVSVTIDDQLKNIDSEIDTKKEREKTANEQIETIETDLETSIQEYQDASAKLQGIDDDIAKKQRELNSATEQLIFYQEIVNKLSVLAYRDGDVYFLEVILGTRSFKDLIVRVDYLTKLTKRQSQILDASRRLRQVIKSNRDQLQSDKQEQKSLVAAVQMKQEAISQLLTQQQNLLDSLDSDIKKLESDKTKKQKQKEEQKLLEAKEATNVSVNIKMLFPLPSPYAHSFINDWGFARAGNRSGHQGTDIFAAKGTPLIAVEDGVIDDNFGYLRIGGWRLHVVTPAGVDYYYAHLNNDTVGTDDGKGGAKTAYAPGIAPGVSVKKGQVIGYVGDSGDAEPTPPHLHFGIVVNGGWTNPFPHLRASDWKY